MARKETELRRLHIVIASLVLSNSLTVVDLDWALYMENKVVNLLSMTSM